jgi:hypothetical protein
MPDAGRFRVVRYRRLARPWPNPRDSLGRLGVPYEGVAQPRVSDECLDPDEAEQRDHMAASSQGRGRTAAATSAASAASTSE